MKIVRLTAENVKRVKAVEIVPDAEGNLVVVSGRNDQGKSSVLDAMWYALGGKDASPDLPIRRGAKKAKVELDLGDLVVTRTWTPDNSYLTVTGKDGEAKKSPQALLDSLVGRLSFDPAAYSRLTPSEQRRIVLELAGLKDKLAAAKSARTKAEQERRDVGRDLRSLEEQARANPIPASSVPAPPDAAELAQKVSALESARDVEAKIKADLDRATEAQGRLQAESERIKSAMDANAAEKSRLEGLVAASSFEQSKLDTARAELAQVGEAQIAYQKAASAAVTLRSLKEARRAHAQHEQTIADIDASVEEMFQTAPLPIPGLSVSDDGVLFNGVPFAQLSSSKQIEVSMAMAMALNPELRVIRILEGSLLDDASMATVTAMAKEHDFQVWMEVVSGRGPSGVVIEDGMVAE